MPRLCHIFSTFAPGGPQVRTVKIIESLPDSFEHTIVAMDCNFSCQKIIARGNVIYREPPRRRNSHLYVFALADWLREQKPDLLLTYNWGAIESIPAGRLAGIHRILHAEDGFNPDELEKQKVRRVLARRVLLKTVARVVVPSQVLFSITRRIWKVPLRKTVYIPNGVNTKHFSPGRQTRLREQYGIAAHECVIGTTGTLGGSKNQAFLLETFAQLAGRHSVRLLLLGDGSHRAALESKANELGVADKVVFAGHVVDPRDHLQVMDIFAMSSKTEQMPIALLEAMAAGLPVVSTEVGDIRAMVCDDNKLFVVALEAPLNYPTALERLIADAALRRRLGAMNREKCLKQYDLQTCHQAYRNLYEKALQM